MPSLKSQIATAKKNIKTAKRKVKKTTNGFADGEVAEIITELPVLDSIIYFTDEGETFVVTVDEAKAVMVNGKYPEELLDKSSLKAEIEKRRKGTKT